MKEFHKALENYNQAIKYYNTLKRSDKVTEIYRILTSIQQDVNLSSAQSPEINDLYQKIEDCINSGHYNEALEFSKRGIEYSRSVGNSKAELDFASYSIDARSEMGRYR